MKLDRKELLSHINDSEKITLLRRILDIMEISLRQYEVMYSDFLDPYEIKLVKSVANRIFELDYEISQEKIAERRVMAFAPEYIPMDVNRAIRLIEIESKLEPLRHPDVLGSILGLGIERNKIGDIAIHDNLAQVIVKEEIGDFLILYLKKVGRIGVKVTENKLSTFKPNIPKYNKKESVIASNRLDNIVSEIYSISRSKAKNYIDGGRVKVNFKREIKPGTEVEENALISLKQYGRSCFFEELGTTRKDRLRITYGRLKEE